MAMLMVTAPAGYAPAMMTPANFAPARATFAHMMADEPEKSFSAEILDDAKDEEEQEFMALAAEKAAAARTPEAAAAHRALADAAVAALRERPEVQAALEKTVKPTGKIAKALFSHFNTLTNEARNYIKHMLEPNWRLKISMAR